MDGRGYTWNADVPIPQVPGGMWRDQKSPQNEALKDYFDWQMSLNGRDSIPKPDKKKYEASGDVSSTALLQLLNFLFDRGRYEDPNKGQSKRGYENALNKADDIIGAR